MIIFKARLTGESLLYRILYEAQPIFKFKKGKACARSRRGLVGSVDEKPGFEPQARHQNKIRKSISSAMSSQQISGKNSDKQIKLP